MEPSCVMPPDSRSKPFPACSREIAATDENGYDVWLSTVRWRYCNVGVYYHTNTKLKRQVVSGLGRRYWHRGMYFTSLPLAIVRCHDHVSRARSVFLVHDLCCDKSFELPNQWVSRLSIWFLGQLFTFNKREDELWKLRLVRHFVQ